MVNGLMDGNAVRLSVVIPAYNEAENIREALDMIVSGLVSLVREFELIVIDDGSTDRTGEIARGFSKAGRTVRVISLEDNRGKGAALISGFRNARMDWILFTDADLQIPAAELKKFLPHTKNFDIITGVRLGRREHFIRRILSRLYTAIMSAFLGIESRDVGCPFKLLKTSAVSNFPLLSQGFLIDAEILYRFQQSGRAVKEIPVACYSRQKGESKVGFRHVIEIVRELAALLR